jgi:putative tricarboxylic transport membrane protein
VKISPFDTVIPQLRDVTKYWRTILRSGLIGTGVGIVPGVGEDVAAWSSYAAAKRASKDKELFGKGSVEGLMAAETGDNACVPGAVIPVLTLAIPGSAPAAVLMAAMIIHGVKPGPMIMVENPQFVYDVVAMMLFATIGILIYGLVLTTALVQVLRVPQHLHRAHHLRAVRGGQLRHCGRLFDVYVMLAFGSSASCCALRLPDGAAGAGHRAGRPAGEEPAPRAGAVRRQPRALLHPADLGPSRR